MSTNTPGIRGGSVKVIVAVIAGLILVVVIYGALRSQPAQTLASRVKTLEDMDGSRDRLIAAQQGRNGVGYRFFLDVGRKVSDTVFSSYLLIQDFVMLR